ncbi:unnamed protein product [Caenorhabditis angaria]|uniref:Uncharacterized protein n=1 Tax=Caenorhabditis angaria TaxID=860376 RepID=A0A9P1J0Q3_9PELO|nr:unnamed protein product [Caenorhabditis angaria]
MALAVRYLAMACHMGNEAEAIKRIVSRDFSSFYQGEILRQLNDAINRLMILITRQEEAKQSVIMHQVHECPIEQEFVIREIIDQMIITNEEIRRAFFRVRRIGGFRIREF